MKKPFILTTDASGSGIGYILSQEDGDKDVVICYGGRALRDAETRYSASEREMLAVKWKRARILAIFYSGNYQLFCISL